MADIHPEFDKLLTKSVPHILEKIFFSLDYESFKICHEVSNSWKELLTSVPFQKKAQSMYLEAKQDNEKKLANFARKGNSEKVCHILAIGVDPNCKSNKSKYTPLYWAIIKNHTEVVKLLLQAGADPNQVIGGLMVGRRDLPLDLAVTCGNKDVVQLLLKAGADASVENDIAILQRETPLFWAAGRGHTDVVKQLLNAGAESNWTNCQGDSSLHLAAIGGHKDMVTLLLNAGADPNKASDKERTPLHEAAKRGHKDVVQLLLDKGADPNKADHWERTPLDLASWNDHKDVAQLFLNRG